MYPQGVDLIDLVVSDTVDEFFETDPRFKSCERGSEAEVTSESEARDLLEVTLLSIEVVDIGVVERARISIRGSGE